MTASQQDRQIADAVRQQRPRLLQFIRRRIPDEAEAEDLLQDVFAELVESYRVLKPVEQAAAWLFRVARNRITDLYRRKRPRAPGRSLRRGRGVGRRRRPAAGRPAARPRRLARKPPAARNPHGSSSATPWPSCPPPSARYFRVARTGGQDLPRDGSRNRRAAQNPDFAQALRRAAPPQTAAKAVHRIIHRLNSEMMKVVKL
ncbi:MAG: sigma-70 family RNA polymerase sigma factor [Hymenobacter sp.]